jgi:hypothetical protein
MRASLCVLIRTHTVPPVLAQEMTALAGEALPVEFQHGGSWHPGVLVGWRQEPDRTCSMRLQFVLGGLRRTSWLPLRDVRLPEPDPFRPPLSLVPRPRGDEDGRSRF